MLIEIAPEEDEIRIPCVCIIIPGVHSRTRVEPEYVLPLFKALWKDHQPDPTEQVRIIPMPDSIPEDARFRRLPSANALEIEIARLRDEFGRHPITKQEVFDLVYPSEILFRDVFNSVCKAAKTVLAKEKMAAINRAEKEVKLAQVAALAASTAAIQAATRAQEVRVGAE